MNEVWEKVSVDPETGCLLWSGATNKAFGRSYPVIRKGGVLVQVARYLWENTHSVSLGHAMGSKLYLSSICKVPLCVSPDHRCIAQPYKVINGQKGQTRADFIAARHAIEVHSANARGDPAFVWGGSPEFLRCDAQGVFSLAEDLFIPRITVLGAYAELVRYSRRVAKYGDKARISFKLS